MFYESKELMKVGYPIHFTRLDDYPKGSAAEITSCVLVSGEAVAEAVIDRLVEVFYRQVEVLLSKGSIGAAVDAFEELLDRRRGATFGQPRLPNDVERQRNLRWSRTVLRVKG